MNISGAYYGFETSLSVGTIMQLVQGQENYAMTINEISDFLYTLPDLPISQDTPPNTINTQNVLDAVIYNDFVYVINSPDRGIIYIACYDGNNIIWTNVIATMDIVRAQLAVNSTGLYVDIKGKGLWQLGDKSVIPWTEEIVALFQFQLIDGVLLNSGYYRGILGSRVAVDESSNDVYLYGFSENPIFYGNSQTPSINKEGLYSFLIFLGPQMNPINIWTSDDSVYTKLRIKSGYIVYTTLTVGSQTVLHVINNNDPLASWELVLGDYLVEDLSIGSVTFSIFGRDKINLLTYNLDAYNLVNTVLPITFVTRNVINFQSLLTFACLAHNAEALYLYTITEGLLGSNTDILSEYWAAGVFVWQTEIPKENRYLQCSGDYVCVGYENNTYKYQKKWPFVVGVVSEILWPSENNPCCDPNTHYLKPGECCGSAGTCTLVPQSSPPYLINTVVKLDFLITDAYSKPNPFLTQVIPGQTYFINNNGNITTASFENGNTNSYFGTAIDSKKILLLRNGNL